VEDDAGWYDPHWHYAHEPETRAALDLIFSDHFSRSEPGIFEPIRHALLDGGDHYRHLADLADYARRTPNWMRAMPIARRGLEGRSSTSRAPASSRAIARSENMPATSGI